MAKSLLRKVNKKLVKLIWKCLHFALFHITAPSAVAADTMCLVLSYTKLDDETTNRIAKTIAILVNIALIVVTIYIIRKHESDISSVYTVNFQFRVSLEWYDICNGFSNAITALILTCTAATAKICHTIMIASHHFPLSMGLWFVFTVCAWNYL